MTDDQIKAFMSDRWRVGDFMDRGQEPCSLRDLRALVDAAVAAERELCARLRALLDAVRLTVDGSAIDQNLRRNIQSALADTEDLRA